MSLGVFVVRRVLWTIPVLLLVILITFLLVRAIATGPFSPEVQPRPVQIKLHLDQPWYEACGWRLTLLTRATRTGFGSRSAAWSPSRCEARTGPASAALDDLHPVAV